MSLNGLDTPAVVEAYQSALADAGGWFLLHYVARDEVALLDRGTGGVPEVRNAIDNYEETSPLYGFLQYRRRKVIIRYMPEGLSRLIQGMYLRIEWKVRPSIGCPSTDLVGFVSARSNVQFQSVLDKFTPNDTVLPLSQASELNESALSSACLLHTASGSITSSSSSLRRRRLMEITEDAEESGAKEEAKEKSVPPPTESRQRSGSQKSEATVVPPIPPTISPNTEEPAPDLRPPPSRASSRAPSHGSPSEPHSSTMSPVLSQKSTDSKSERSKYRNILDEFPRPSEEVRMSTQSARPSLRELERASGYTPKVKLGPRPSLDQSGRPRTSGSSRNSDQRPVASLPAGMRSSSLRKPNVEAPRPRSQGSSFATKPSTRAPPPIPPLLVPPPSIPISRPQLSPGAKSLGALSTSSGLTPEKERLMKALQQRRKHLAKRAEEKETKKKQVITEAEEEPKPITDATQSPGENKENVNLVPEPEDPRPEKLQHDETPEPAEPPVSSPEPLSQGQNPAEPEDPFPASVEPSQLEPTLDVIVSDSEGGPSSHTSAPSADTTFSTDNADTALEDVKSETPRTVLENEDETRAENRNPANPSENEASENEAQADLVHPSVNDEVSLDPIPAENTTPAPEPEVATPSPQADVPSVASEPVKHSPAEIITAEAPESVSVPTTSPADTPSSPVAEPSVAPVSVSIEPVPLDETATEEPRLEKTEPLPLDQRRRIHLEPIQVPTPEYSDDDNLLSDDSFMEELRSATVQQARPVAVKSPSGGDQSWRGSSRAVSSPYGPTSPSAVQALAASGRSVSSSYPDNGPPTPVLVAKKINVSSGISSRIKALEKFSSREGTPSNSSPTVTAPSASSSFENLRKRASVSLPNGSQEFGSSFSRAPSLNHHDSRPSSTVTRRTNSISVTARIVRDTSGSQGPEPAEPAALNLAASPLTVEHETTENPMSRSLESITRPENRSMSVSSAGSSRQAAQVSRPASRLSLSSRSKTDENFQSTSPTADDKKGSRASRLMRRMSSITSSSRRSIIGALSSPVKEEDPAFAAGDDSAISPTSSRQRLSEPVDIGEVNVQFPDTLLWKRRCMRIDESGYLVLMSGNNDSSARNMIKRYHLTEFRTPCLPDEDMQELPNSILLDFLDGSTLQCACESRQGQATVLQTLIDAHNAHQS
ncbi:uncharacterized protein N7459_003148 [Penicillium hispanicum]|uniref:uncharacterized protein n=1 Tax=Penicillium hispanicum TaxID=1080232 RepID=UPI0025421693|nr:uncharacterized protein N7459_003148 [Penicillium hispanicum]KAJ5587383.1 hypothetical protein N7459_003148 [Penicillium hispanicum]